MILWSSRSEWDGILKYDHSVLGFGYLVLVVLGAFGFIYHVFWVSIGAQDVIECSVLFIGCCLSGVLCCIRFRSLRMN